MQVTAHRRLNPLKGKSCSDHWKCLFKGHPHNLRGSWVQQEIPLSQHRTVWALQTHQFTAGAPCLSLGRDLGQDFLAGKAVGEALLQNRQSKPNREVFLLLCSLDGNQPMHTDPYISEADYHWPLKNRNRVSLHGKVEARPLEIKGLPSQGAPLLKGTASRARGLPQAPQTYNCILFPGAGSAA